MRKRIAVVGGTAAIMLSILSLGPVFTETAAAAPITTAPGVDHAIRIGFRVAREKTIVGTPMPIPIAQIQDAACSGLAWRFCAA